MAVLVPQLIWAEALSNSSRTSTNAESHITFAEVTLDLTGVVTNTFAASVMADLILAHTVAAVLLRVVDTPHHR